MLRFLQIIDQCPLVFKVLCGNNAIQLIIKSGRNNPSGVFFSRRIMNTKTSEAKEICNTSLQLCSSARKFHKVCVLYIEVLIKQREE